MNKSFGNTGLPEIWRGRLARVVKGGESNLICLQTQGTPQAVVLEHIHMTKKELRNAKSVHQPTNMSKNGTTSLSILSANESASVAN